MEEKYVNASVAWTQQFCRINSFLGAGKREVVFLAEKILKESCDANVTVYDADTEEPYICLLYTSPSRRDRSLSRMPSSA